MVDHTRDAENEQQLDASFHPVDGISGQCECGHVFNYVAFEGEVTCDGCGTTWNVYVDHEKWD